MAKTYDNFHFAVAGKTAALIEFNYEERADVGKVDPVQIGSSSYRIKKWGANNDLPQYREDQLRDNNINGELISTKAAFIVGEGIYPYVMIDGKAEWLDLPDAIQEFYDDHAYLEILTTAARDWSMHSNAVIEFDKQVKGDIVGVQTLRVKNMRLAEKENTGKVTKAYYHPDWKKEDTRIRKEVTTIKIYDKNIRAGRFLLWLKDNLFDDGYYGHPAYWGGKEWIELSNIIPKFHKANLRNGYTLRFHVKIPKDYFLDVAKYDDANTDEEKKECMDKALASREAFVNKVNKFLAGVENSGRALFTTYDFDMALGKEYPGIIISPINFDMKDESLLKLFEKANEASYVGHGIPAVLAGIQTAGKLSAGNEIRNAYNFWITIKPLLARRALMRAHKLIVTSNNWNALFPQQNVKWGFRSIELNTIDIVPEGKSTVVDPAE